MTLIADILLIAGALGSAIYCIVLSRRLKKFNDLEHGVGGAVALMSTQVDDMTKTLSKAQNAAISSTSSLLELTTRAEKSAQHLELLVASLHDLPKASEPELRPKDDEKVVEYEDLQFLRHSQKPKEETTA
ncbi:MULTISPECIES: hypothetical protein [Falsihalocynthiibacter]|uniref:hypothetical protein n=1 Tax=Falsihalocynthiibacter TaxID=2854182 RepID=UPI003002EB11